MVYLATKRSVTIDYVVIILLVLFVPVIVLAAAVTFYTPKDTNCHITNIQNPDIGFDEGEISRFRDYNRTQFVPETYFVVDGLSYLAYTDKSPGEGVEEASFGFKEIDCVQLDSLLSRSSYKIIGTENIYNYLRNYYE